MNERIVTELIESFGKLFWAGVKVSIPLTVTSFSAGLLIAFLVALAQIAKVPILRRLVRIYVWIIRCTPMIVQLFVVYFGLPSIGITLNSFFSAWLVMSLSVGAYILAGYDICHSSPGAENSISTTVQFDNWSGERYITCLQCRIGGNSCNSPENSCKDL